MEYCVVGVHRRSAAVLTVGLVTAIAAAILVPVAVAQTAPERAAITGTHPAWANESRRVSSSPVANDTVKARVYLASSDPSALAAYAEAVSDPQNPLYGKYLSSDEVRSRFGPGGSAIKEVRSWLTGAGLAVTNVNDRIGGYVEVRGSLEAAAQAFGVTFGTYRGPDNRAHRAPEQEASAPTAVASHVLEVTGLDTAPHHMRPYDTLPPPNPNYWVAPPCTSWYGQELATGVPPAYSSAHPWQTCGYEPRQIRQVYGVTGSRMTGAGQTVAIVDAYASATMLSDANKYAALTGDPQFKPGQYTEVLASDFTQTAPDECDAAGWYTEETLDVEAVHGQAPNANIVYVGAASCSDDDLVDALTLIVDNNLATIVSDSWGEPFDQASMISTYNEVFQAGAVKGIGFFFSTGDNGYESPAEDGFSDKIQVDWPTSSPYVTSVGGTTLAIGWGNSYEFETAWGTLLDPLASNGKTWQYTPPGPYPQEYSGSGGGGVSTVFAQPSYQIGVVPYSLATALPDGETASDPMRVIPDVAALADWNLGMLIGQTDLQPDGKTYAFATSKIGGTSVACPTFAGIQADAQQAAGHRLGFANPAIYRRYGTRAFRDIVPHSDLAVVVNTYADPYTKTGPFYTYLGTFGIDGEGAEALPAQRGYDDATGVGSPNCYIQSFMLGGELFCRE
jgi:subtilase family serine protease